MQILKTSRFLDELDVIANFIAEDSLSQALIFLDKLENIIYTLSDTPYRCRQSSKSNDVNVRELVFQGYVVPYRVSKEKNRIELIGIFSANEWEM